MARNLLWLPTEQELQLLLRVRWQDVLRFFHLRNFERRTCPFQIRIDGADSTVTATRTQAFLSHPDDYVFQFLFSGNLGRQPLEIVGVPGDCCRRNVVQVLAFADELLEFR